MNEIIANRPDLLGRDDAETIQNAINEAARTGCRRAVVPRYNIARKDTLWRIARAIKLPGDFTLILDNCHMVQETGVYDHMFTNERPQKETGFNLEDERHNISVIGRGNVLLEGGEHNGLLEKTSGRMGLPSIWKNTMFFWHNVQNLRVENLRIRDQRWWAMTHLYCRNVVLKDLDFFAIPHVPNMDGIDLRVGCSDFLLENITGRTGDDTVALTALSGTFERKCAVEGKKSDICRVKIRNVLSDPFLCLMVRLLNEDGNCIYDVEMDGLFDTSWFGQKRRPGSNVCIGGQGNIYSSIRSGSKGETKNVCGRHIFGRGASILRFDKFCEDFSFYDIKSFGDNSLGIGTSGFGAQLKNVTVNGLFFGSDPKHTTVPVTANPQGYRNTLVHLPKVSGKLSVSGVEADNLYRLCVLDDDMTLDLFAAKPLEYKETGILSDSSHLIINGEEQDHE